MDAADAAPLGAWASVRGYFTPATLFLVVNLVIGTIALTSRFTHQRRRRDQHHHYPDDAHRHHLQEPPHPQEHQGYGLYYDQHQQQYVPPPPPAPLARTSSVLDRLRSLGLYRFRSGDFPPEYGAAQETFSPAAEEEAHYARSQSEPAPTREQTRSRVKKSGSEVRKAQVAARPPARVIEAVAEDEAVDTRPQWRESTGSFFRREPSPLRHEEYQYQEEYVPPPVPASAPAPLARTSSVLDRLRSLDIYGFLAPQQPAAASTPARDVFATPADETHAHAPYDRSRSEPSREQGKREKKQQEAKSSTGARKTAAPVLAAAGECVDARAEAFIDSFRQQQAQHHQEEYAPPPAPAPLPRTSSVLDRLRSFGLYSFRSGDLGPEVPAETTTPAADEKAHAHYGRSRSEPAREQGKKEARMSKSSSSSVVEEPEVDGGVDARADDFINKFRQQLQLQRLNSLLNYKEMLGRGGGKQ